MKQKIAPLTPEQQTNIDNGLTIDGRQIVKCKNLCDSPHCPCGCGAHFGCFNFEPILIGFD
jgi:hypothetical protein